MAGDPFARMAGRLLQHLGRPALLRGNVATRVSIEHGVQVYGEYGQVVGTVSVATLLAELRALPGEALVMDGVPYRIERRDRHDGVFDRFVVMPGE